EAPGHNVHDAQPRHDVQPEDSGWGARMAAVEHGPLAGGAADDQTWTRQPNGTIVHTKTGLCLSGQIPAPVLVGRGGPGITVGGGPSPTVSGSTGTPVGGGTGPPPSVSLPRLNLAACNAGPPDQVWSTIDPTNPPPPIR